MPEIFDAKIIGGTINPDSIRIDNIAICRNCFETSQPFQYVHPQFVDGWRRCDGCGKSLKPST